MSEEEIIGKLKLWMECASINNGNSCIVNNAELQGLLDLYDKEKEKNKKVEKFCKEKSTFQTFGDSDMQYVLETYINRLKHRILDLLEE